MADYRKIFPKKHTFLPVIHVESTPQAIRNTLIAFNEGADGVFLINHSVEAKYLYRTYQAVRDYHPHKWIGLNWLDLFPRDALGMMRPGMGGMWVDAAGIKEDPPEAEESRQFAELKGDWEDAWGASFLLFGGVAFKYQKAVKDFARVAKLAKPYMDVITTSGEGTGHAPGVDKIHTMKKANPAHPLAIASGITPENVCEFMPYADCFLVATGISDSHTELNAKRVAKFVRAIS
jgi:hypothetical protein